MRRRLAALLAVLSVGLLGPQAQQPLVGGVVEERVTWRFTSEALDVAGFLHACSAALGVAIEVDGALAGQPIAVDTQRGFGRADLLQLAERELAARGLAVVQPPESKVLRCVLLADAAQSARLEPFALELSEALYLKALFELHRRTPEALLDPLRTLLSKQGSVTALRDTKGLLVTDLRSHVLQVGRFLATVDAALEEPLIEELRLAYTGPAALSALLERISAARKLVTGESLQGVLLPVAENHSVLVVAPEEEMPWWRTSIERFDRPEAVETIGYHPRRFGLADTARLVEEVAAPTSDPNFHLVEDTLTGTLLVTARASVHQAIEVLFQRLESTSAEPQRPMRAFPIEHRRVSEVLELLDQLIEAGVLEGATSPDPANPNPPQGATGGPVHQQRAEVTLAPDEGTSRILAFGPAHLLDQIGRLIDELDRPQAQVLVEATIVTLSEQEMLDLGVELQTIGVDGDTAFQLGTLFGLGVPAASATSLPAPSGSGASGVVLDPGDWSALVRALSTVSEGRTLSSPRVLVTSGSSARLDSVLQTPYASTNASTTVATTSFGGTLDAGTTIEVKPQVAAGDRIVLEYTITLSTFTGESSDPNLPPPREQQKLSSFIAVPDGSTVVVGGLEVSSATRGSSEVPFLGQIPLLGWLFSNRSSSSTRSRFFVFLKVDTLRATNFEDLRYQSSGDLQAARLDDGLPVLKPRVIR